MIKLTVILLLALVAIYNVQGLPLDGETSGSIIPTPEPKACSANASPISTRSDLNCILNCANVANPPFACTKILYFGSFCKCNEGFIFKAGTDGECIKAEDCGK